MWWQAIGKRLRSTLKGQLMKSILAFGDSNTWGLVPGSKTLERYPDTVRWTGILQKSVSDTRIIEEGLCGRTTVFEDALRPGRKGVASLSISLESQCPVDAVILMLGTNDCKAFYNVTPETIGLGIEQCVNEIEKYVSEYCRLFGADYDTVMDSPFSVVIPDSRNPYKQLYVAN